MYHDGMVRRLAAGLVYLLVAGALLFLVWLWLLSDRSGQQKTLTTVPIAFALGLVAIVALFRVRGPMRRLARVAAVALVAAGVSVPVLFRITGVSGDFFPILEYRFAPKPDATLPSLPGVAPQAVVEAPAEALVEAPSPETAPAEAPAAAREAAATETPARVEAEAAPAPPAMVSPADAGFAALSFPQYLGPTREGRVAGVRLARDWAASPPALVWKIPVGAGWSGFVIERGLAITQEQRGPDEMVVAYDVATGQPRWSHRDPTRYDSVIAGDGPRATPTIAGPYVVTLGSKGLLSVLDFATGRRRWHKDIVADNQATDPEWGRAGSPLVYDGKVIVTAGGPNGALVAYDLATGARVWRAGTDNPSYAAPMVLTLLGRPQVVAFNAMSMTGHDPGTGAVLWSRPWPSPINVAQPIRVADDLVLGTTGYGIGAKLAKLSEQPDGSIQSAFVWETPRLKAKFTNPVLHDGFVYGLDEGVLVCLDLTTGERRWRAGRYGHGQTLLAGDLLLVTTEYGEVVLVDPSPDAHRELTRFTALDGKTWNPPALAGPYLLVRSDREAALFRLPTE